MKWFLICFCTMIFSIGCSLYQSDARKFIENGTIDTSPSASNLFIEEEGLSCYKSALLPEYLKHPLEVVATPYEKQKYGTLMDSKSHWLAVHRHDQASGLHFSCEFQFLSSEHLDLQLDMAIHRGVELINEQLGL